ncbi:hypothetical protein [Azohydromonas aeria]|uniref:hypothetical protein n=1 Tax=Azohydromonas aeria TaxID=2590212 RepID=UPI0012F7677D|nr:hypothetical protein [Azohydromonas aeria]
MEFFTPQPPLADFPIAGTPLRALVLRGPMSLLAYIGVPLDHWAAGTDLDFRCHWGITFEGEGEGMMRPAGWYWWGWDYGHCTDVVDLPPLSPEWQERIDDFRRALLEHFNDWREDRGLEPVTGFTPMEQKRWTAAEVVEDVMDVAMNVKAALEAAEAGAAALSGGNADS